MTPHAKVLEEIIRRHKWTRGAELGVLAGATLFYLLDRFSDLGMVGVDIWRHHPELDRYRDIGGRSYRKYNMAEIRRSALRRSEDYIGRVNLYEMTTVEASKLFPEEHFDFVFIDADHLYEAIRKDINHWRPKVREGGMLLGHDYSNTFPGVKKAVDEIFGESVVLQKNTIWSVQL